MQRVCGPCFWRPTEIRTESFMYETGFKRSLAIKRRASSSSEMRCAFSSKWFQTETHTIAILREVHVLVAQGTAVVFSPEWGSEIEPFRAIIEEISSYSWSLLAVAYRVSSSVMGTNE